MTRPFTLRTVLSATVITVAVAGAWAQTPQSPAKSEIDPAALAALNEMGAYLRTLKAYQIEAATTDEDVLDDGQKMQYDGKVDVLVRAPDGLRAEVSDERHERRYLYNGKVFTLFAPRPNLYATVKAPATLRQLVDTLDEDYGLSIPLVDLFRWGLAEDSAKNIKRATDLGSSVVAGTTCEHYAFRQDDMDWQIWIQKGTYPLPRKLVITTKTDEARPQHSVVYTWNLAPSFNEAAFTFDPPEGASKVALSPEKTLDSAQPGAKPAKP